MKFTEEVHRRNRVMHRVIGKQLSTVNRLSEDRKIYRVEHSHHKESKNVDREKDFYKEFDIIHREWEGEKGRTNRRILCSSVSGQQKVYSIRTPSLFICREIGI